MRFEAGQRITVDGRKARVVDHNANTPHIVVIRYDNGGIFKVEMHRVRVIEDEAQRDDAKRGRVNLADLASGEMTDQTINRYDAARIRALLEEVHRETNEIADALFGARTMPKAERQQLARKLNASRAKLRTALITIDKARS